MGHGGQGPPFKMTLEGNVGENCPMMFSISVLNQVLCIEFKFHHAELGSLHDILKE